MWKKLSIASKLMISLVIVVVLGFSSLVLEQWLTLKDGLQTLENRNREAMTALMAQNISGAVRWKKSDVIEKAYQQLVSSPDSNVTNIIATDNEAAVLSEFTHSDIPALELKSSVTALTEQLGDADSISQDLGEHSLIAQKVFSGKNGNVVGYLVMVFTNKELDAFVAARGLVGALISLVAILTIIAATFFIVRGLFSRPMTQLNEIANDLANGEGDLTQRLAINSRDELGELAGHINSFLEKLQTAVSTVVSSAAEVKESLGTASSTADENRTLLDQQSTELSQAASSVQTMSQRLGRMSDSAQGLASATSDARVEAEAADKMADDAVAAVTSLTSRMEESEQVVSTLREQSDSIGSVLGVIEGIAEQTNLLALNAAIEAARAGEQGRGFAVVADEVRTLASRTQQSTEEIKGIIDGLQNGAQNAVNTMEQSQADVGKSASQINQVKQSLAQIVSHMERITTTNSEVAEEIVEQSNVASGVSSNIDELNNLSASILENGTSTARCCEQSSEINDKLNDQVAFFKV
ncbi:MAG: methyl-accepting chemotaxis protein [Gammaproteobacteria bacterium]|nr:methyl-accepting chemotaxis protein [Gammaproteobacteria bacterium]